MVSKADISRWTGLSGVQVGHIIRALEKKDIDWAQVVDWETLGGDVRDFSERYDMVWKKLGSMYGISRPIPAIRKEIETAKAEELEYLTRSKEGVKSLLRRIYKEPSLSKKEREKLKEHLIGAAPEYATLIALYDGEEQKMARRFLAEEVVAPTPIEVKEFLKKDTLKILSERGWIKEIDDVPLKKPLRSIVFIKELQEKGFKSIAGERVDGQIAIFSRKKPEEVAIPIPPVVEEKPVVAIPEVPKAKIEDLATQYSYAEVLAIAKQHDIQSGPKVKMLSELLEKGVL